MVNELLKLKIIPLWHKNFQDLSKDLKFIIMFILGLYPCSQKFSAVSTWKCQLAQLNNSDNLYHKLVFNVLHKKSIHVTSV